MTDNGYVYAYRRVWSHPLFRDLLDAAIWNYLYQNAAWQDCRVVAHGEKIELKRGQIFTSPRRLAEGFCCHESRIRRLTKALSDDAQILIQTTHKGSIITICNYEKYQASYKPDDAQTTHRSRLGEQPNDAPLIKNKEIKEIKEGNKTKSVSADSSYTADFDELWKAYPPNNGDKKTAFKTYLQTLKGTEHGRIIEGARRYSAHILGENRPDARRFTKHLSTWLNACGWETEYQPYFAPTGGTVIQPGTAFPAAKRTYADAAAEAKQLIREGKL